MKKENLDPSTVISFGDEWARFDQSSVPEPELRRFFDEYFFLFPWGRLPVGAEGFDMGCGSGRWAKLVAPRVGKLHCIDPSGQALEVARQNLRTVLNVELHHASVDTVPLAPASLDFGYSLGVLHHIPDTQAAMASCVKLLKPGAPFLVYLYYRFDNRSPLFRSLWAASDVVRKGISKLPRSIKHRVTDALAAMVYWPLSRSARMLERFGFKVKGLPLYAYRHASFYTMRTDSLDRFGTPLEHRFTRAEITQMMEKSGLRDVAISPDAPYWCAMGFKA